MATVAPPPFVDSGPGGGGTPGGSAPAPGNPTSFTQNSVVPLPATEEVEFVIPEGTREIRFRVLTADAEIRDVSGGIGWPMEASGPFLTIKDRNLGNTHLWFYSTAGTTMYVKMDGGLGV